ncbi:MAG: hypothetical protein WA667_07940 [Candidatus Nitrosopolaris sp.]
MHTKVYHAKNSHHGRSIVCYDDINDHVSNGICIHTPAWAGLVPDDLKEELDLAPRYSSIKILQNGDYIVGDEFELEDAWIKYREHLLRKEKDIGIRVKSTDSARFILASKLVSDGVIPWSSRTVTQSWRSFQGDRTETTEDVNSKLDYCFNPFLTGMAMWQAWLDMYNEFAAISMRLSLIWFDLG